MPKPAKVYQNKSICQYLWQKSTLFLPNVFVRIIVLLPIVDPFNVLGFVTLNSVFIIIFRAGYNEVCFF